MVKRQRGSAVYPQFEGIGMQDVRWTSALHGPEWNGDLPQQAKMRRVYTGALLAKVVPNSVQSSLYRKNSYTEFFARAQFIKDFLSRIRYNFSKPGSVSDSKMLRIPLIFGITFLFIL